jgi:hypothetical protein
VTINDTVTLSKKLGEQPPPLMDFQLGFPYKYKFNIYQISAYDSQTQQKLLLDLDTGLGSVGFYGVKVHFKNQVDLNTQASYSFILVTEFSDLINAQPPEDSLLFFDLNYPVYPSLAQEVSVSNTTVFLPVNANYTSSDPTLNQTASRAFSIVKQPLDPFTSVNGTMRFTPSGSFILQEVNELKRDAVLDEWNGLSVSDSYTVTNKAAQDTLTLWTLLPQDASDASAKDDLGNELSLTQQSVSGAIKATITLKTAVKPSQTIRYSVTFKLPWKNHVVQNGWNDFSLNLKLFEAMNLTVRKLTVSIDLPEGAVFAKFQSSNDAIQSDFVQLGAYEETPTFTVSNVSSFQNLDLTVTYKHVIFWSSFRPTLWTGALVAFIGAIVFLWQMRRAPVSVTTALPIRPEELRNYVKTYEEERKILQERESLEAQARKGKIPRRLYRVRSRTLETRLSVLSRDLAALRDKIRVAGPQYSGMMRQIEVAQTELQGVEADIRRTEARYRRGEISASAYHKLLEDSYRRRDRAKTNIDGVLLRLREETS